MKNNSNPATINIPLEALRFLLNYSNYAIFIKKIIFKSMFEVRAASSARTS